jgi:hypothetical protein
MTILAGVDLGEYALFAADSRETIYHPDRPELELREDFQKIVATPIGLAAGSGLTLATMGAISDLNTKPAEALRKPDDIGQYFREFVPAFAKSAGVRVDDPRVVEQLDRCAWLLSWSKRRALEVVA